MGGGGGRRAAVCAHHWTHKTAEHRPRTLPTPERQGAFTPAPGPPLRSVKVAAGNKCTLARFNTDLEWRLVQPVGWRPCWWGIGRINFSSISRDFPGLEWKDVDPRKTLLSWESQDSLSWENLGRTGWIPGWPVPGACSRSPLTLLPEVRKIMGGPTEVLDQMWGELLPLA